MEGNKEVYFQVQQLKEDKIKGKYFVDIEGMSYPTAEKAHQVLRKRELQNAVVVMREKKHRE